MNTTDFKKLQTTLRRDLAAMARFDPQYYQVVKLMAAAAKYHTGIRKDGVTPEFYHQLSILGVAMTQHKNLIFPAMVFMAIIAHDLVEDYPESKAMLMRDFPEVLEYSIRLSKYRDGVQIPKAQYYAENGACPVCSAVKLLDRKHNISTMTAAFKDPKMLSYAQEVEDDFLPMAKRARELFPEQAEFYELVKSNLSDQVAMIKFFVPRKMAQEARIAELEARVLELEPKRKPELDVSL